MKVRIAPGCNAYGECAKVCPEVFKLDDFGYALVDEEAEIPSELHARVREAAKVCPTSAVLIEE